MRAPYSKPASSERPSFTERSGPTPSCVQERYVGGLDPPIGREMPEPSISRPYSIPPPGVNAPEALGAVQSPTPVAVLGADGAVRSRLNAAIADSLILGALARVLLYATGLGAASKEALLLLLMVNWLYYTVAEIAQGQTPGKRRFGVRVVSADGTPAHPAQIAVRNALRIVDAVPLLYTSGLISMWRTGRSQRQRIGDVVAGTAVVPVEGRESLLASPRWLLPSVAAVALVLSVLVFITAARA